MNTIKRIRSVKNKKGKAERLKIKQIEIKLSLKGMTFIEIMYIYAV